MEYGGDDSDADEDYDVDKDCHAEQSEDSDSDFDNPRKECRTRRIRSIKDTSKKVQTPQVNFLFFSVVSDTNYISVNICTH